MGAQGTTTIDFGAFPGLSDAAIILGGQAGIVAGSCAEAWIRPEDSVDHSADEHWVENIEITATAIIPGTGFVIRAINRTPIGNTRLYGVWNINWVWN